VKWLEEFNIAMKSVSGGLEILDRNKSELLAHTKESLRDIVTNIDTEIECCIKEMLRDSPYKIVGEESFVARMNVNWKDDTVWVVDPIDGTTNMVAGIPFYCVSLGLLHKAEFELGVVAVPAQEALYFSFNEQAYMNNKQLRVKPTNFEKSLNACAFSGKAYGENRYLEYEAFGEVNDRTCGCLRTGSAAMNVCYVATGQLQSAYGINNRIWDVAAALAIARHAGAQIYIEWKQDGSFINYAVGVPGVVEEIVNILNGKVVTNLSLLR
jgi:myo-inositol-1(or 4)-monophosphatase